MPNGKERDVHADDDTSGDDQSPCKRALTLNSDEENESSCKRSRPKSSDASILASVIPGNDPKINVPISILQKAYHQLKYLDAQNVAKQDRINQLEDQMKTTAQSYQNDLSKFEEGLSCSLCELWLWHPRILQCGHAFCETCLVRWFESKRPTLTCPSCREPVRERPANVFVVKDIVQTLFNAKTRLGVEAEAERPPEAETKMALERWDFDGPMIQEDVRIQRQQQPPRAMPPVNAIPVPQLPHQVNHDPFVFWQPPARRTRTNRPAS